ncbi:hypothetical protein ISCGN_010018 [Ixodes scapularis]
MCGTNQKGMFCVLWVAAGGAVRIRFATHHVEPHGSVWATSPKPVEKACLSLRELAGNHGGWPPRCDPRMWMPFSGQPVRCQESRRETGSIAKQGTIPCLQLPLPQTRLSPAVGLHYEASEAAEEHLLSLVCGSEIRRCCVFKCVACKADGVSLFQFRRNRTLKIKWSRVIGRDRFGASDSTLECSTHFPDDLVDKKACQGFPSEDASGLSSSHEYLDLGQVTTIVVKQGVPAQAHASGAPQGMIFSGFHRSIDLILRGVVHLRLQVPCIALERRRCSRCFLPSSPRRRISIGSSALPALRTLPSVTCLLRFSSLLFSTRREVGLFGS